MLHTLSHKKRNEGDVKEDDVTGAFFGALEFFAPESRVQVLCRCFRDYWADRGRSSLAGVPDPAEAQDALIQFWPNIALHGRREPDLIIQFIQPGGVEGLKLLIEIKWESPQSQRDSEGNECQLDAQWQHETDRNRTLHVYLTKYPAPFGEVGENHKNHLIHVSWGHLVGKIMDAEFSDAAVQRWKSRVKLAFDRLGICGFSGLSCDGFARQWRAPDWSGLLVTGPLEKH